MTADEIQAAIDRAEAKRRELEEQGAAAKPSSRLFTMLPQAAEAYRRQITQGLAGDARAALKARMLLKELFGGEIRLVPDDQGGLVAHWNLHTAALLRGVGTVGSGGRLPPGGRWHDVRPPRSPAVWAPPGRALPTPARSPRVPGHAGP
jgi:hypothetical protein